MSDSEAKRPLIFLVGSPVSEVISLGEKACQSLGLTFLDLSHEFDENEFRATIENQTADVISLSWEIVQNSDGLKLSRSFGTLIGIWAHSLKVPEQSDASGTKDVPDETSETLGGFDRTGTASRELQMLIQGCDCILDFADTSSNTELFETLVARVEEIVSAENCRTSSQTIISSKSTSAKENEGVDNNISEKEKATTCEVQSSGESVSSTCERDEINTFITRLTPNPRVANQGSPCLVLIYPPGPSLGEKFIIDQIPVNIGRSSSNDIVVNEHLVSRHHARIVLRNCDKVLLDLESSNGTLVNDNLIWEHQLQSGDQIKIGYSIFKFLDGRDIEESYHEEIYRLMHIDGLTQTYNKRYFINRLENELKRARRHNLELSLIFFDIDHFKQVNDNFGSFRADTVLKKICQIVHLEIGQEEHLCRYEGDEFAILLPGINEYRTIEIAENIRAVLEKKDFEYGDEIIPVTISMGVVTAGAGLDESESFIEAAHLRLSEAKSTGRNRVCPELPNSKLVPISHEGRGENRKNEFLEDGKKNNQRTSIRYENVARPPRTKPVDWLPKILSSVPENQKVALGACALRNVVEMVASSERPQIKEFEWALERSLFDETLHVFKYRDGVYLYLAEVKNVGTLNLLREKIAKNFKENFSYRWVSESGPLEILHGNAMVDEEDPNVEALKRLALASLGAHLGADNETVKPSELPHPLAFSLMRVGTAARADETVWAYIEAVESAIRFLACILAAGLESMFSVKLEEVPDKIEKVLEDNFTMGRLAFFVRETAALAYGSDDPMLSSIGRFLVTSKGKWLGPLRTSKWLVKIRNDVAHQRIKGAAGAESILPELEEKVQEFFRGLEFLSDYHLATVLDLEFGRDNFFTYRMRDHTGPDVLFDVSERRGKIPLPKSTYLFDRGSESALDLAPFIVCAQCKICGQRELFWSPELRLKRKIRYQGVAFGHLLDADTPDWDNLAAIFREED